MRDNLSDQLYNLRCFLSMSYPSSCFPISYMRRYLNDTSSPIRVFFDINQSIRSEIDYIIK